MEGAEFGPAELSRFLVISFLAFDLKRVVFYLFELMVGVEDLGVLVVGFDFWRELG